MSQPAKPEQTFDDWLREVERRVHHKHKLYLDDLPDHHPWEDRWNDQMTPREAAEMVDFDIEMDPLSYA